MKPQMPDKKLGKELVSNVYCQASGSYNQINLRDAMHVGRHTSSDSENRDKKKVLLVDDDNEHLVMLENCFHRMGIKPTLAGGGACAVELLNKDSYDIVVSDIQMPGMDGMEVLHYIKKHFPTTDVILITGYSDKYSFTDVINDGSTDYLEKPFSKNVIEAKVNRIFRERDEVNRRRITEENLRRRSHERDKRIRELDCLYKISKFIDRDENYFDKIIDGVLKLMPSAWEYPESMAFRIVYQGREYRSARFRETPQSLCRAIQGDNIELGALEVYYIKSPAGNSENPFPREKKDFINEIVDKLSRAARRQRMNLRLCETTEELRRSQQTLEQKVQQRTKDLHETKAELTSVFESVPDGIVSVDDSMIVIHQNRHFTYYLTADEGQTFQAGGSKFQQECYRILSNTITNHQPVVDYRLEFNKGENSHKVFLVSSSCLSRENGECVGAILIIHDITKVAVLESKLRERRQFRKIIGESPKIQEIFKRISQISDFDTTVLITGKSGVGKELIIDTLHAQGDRYSKPLVKVNCSALPENLLESELFGHVKGAFTGASRDRAGRIMLAEGGILFLDEIGDISQRLQLKLLRFLEQKEYERVGDSRKRTADVRIFAATNANLLEKVNNGSFREDLYYRLKVMVIHVPPLRERKEDIPLLIDHFITVFNEKFNKQISGISREALEVLMNCRWPGNVRELRHAFEHAFLLCQGTELELNDFPRDILDRQVETLPRKQPARTLSKECLQRALNDTHWHKSKTARLLKISRATLYNKLKEFDLIENKS